MYFVTDGVPYASYAHATLRLKGVACETRVCVNLNNIPKDRQMHCASDYFRLNSTSLILSMRIAGYVSPSCGKVHAGLIS